jgi:hypothetical protein
VQARRREQIGEPGVLTELRFDPIEEGHGAKERERLFKVLRRRDDETLDLLREFGDAAVADEVRELAVDVDDALS